MKSSPFSKQKWHKAGLLAFLIIAPGGLLPNSLQAQCPKSKIPCDSIIVKTDTTRIENCSESKACCQKTDRLAGIGDSTTLYILDGKPITKKEFEKIPTENIDRLEILKGDRATVVYGEKGKSGVIIAETKQDHKLKDALIILDGKPATREQMDNLQISWIRSISMLKGSPASTLYGNKGLVGTIIIDTQKPGSTDGKKIKSPKGETTAPMAPIPANKKGNSKTVDKKTANNNPNAQRNIVLKKLKKLERSKRVNSVQYRRLKAEQARLNQLIKEQKMRQP